MAVTVLDTLDTLVAKRFYERVQQAKIDMANGLLEGAAVAATHEKTTMNYVGQVQYIRALGHAMEWLEEIEEELTGRKKHSRR